MSIQIPIYNLEGKEVELKELNEKVFKVEVNEDLLSRVALTFLNNKRRGTAHTKTRDEVRGGGKKPWKQKGTGNARAGSIRSPIFRGGGVIFGPRNKKNYLRKINKKVKRLALRMTLTKKLENEKIKVVDDFSFKKPSTKKMINLLNKLKAKDKTVLMASKEINHNLKKSLGNLQKVRYVLASNINSLDLLNHNFLYIDKGALEYFENLK